MFGHLGQIAAETGGSAKEHHLKWRNPVGHIEAEASNIGNHRMAAAEQMVKPIQRVEDQLILTSAPPLIAAKRDLPTEITFSVCAVNQHFRKCRSIDEPLVGAESCKGMYGVCRIAHQHNPMIDISFHVAVNQCKPFPMTDRGNAT